LFYSGESFLKNYFDDSLAKYSFDVWLNPVFTKKRRKINETIREAFIVLDFKIKVLQTYETKFPLPIFNWQKDELFY